MKFHNCIHFTKRRLPGIKLIYKQESYYIAFEKVTFSSVSVINNRNGDNKKCQIVGPQSFDRGLGKTCFWGRGREAQLERCLTLIRWFPCDSVKRKNCNFYEYRRVVGSQCILCSSLTVFILDEKARRGLERVKRVLRERG